MDIETYLERVEDWGNRLAIRQLNDEEINSWDFLDMEIRQEDSNRELVVFAAEQIFNQEELQRKAAFLDLALFEMFENEEHRLTCILIACEIERLRTLIGLRKRLALYVDEHPLFRESPAVKQLVYNGELIRWEGLEQISRSEVIKIDRMFYKLDAQLDPLILHWTLEHCAGSDIFIRLDPFKVYNERPSYTMNEDVLRPPNPDWIHQLSIHKRANEGARYFIPEETDISDDQLKWWEYNVAHIRRLEISASRRNDGNLSMMVEEIREFKLDGYVIGLCIHLDTSAPFGTFLQSAILNHLDLAVNVYEGDTGSIRLGQDLSQGKVVDASFRTHLLRVNNLPMQSLIAYSRSFFKSHILTAEWISDQFGGMSY